MNIRDFFLNTFNTDSFGNKDIFINIGNDCFNLISDENKRSPDFNINQIARIVEKYGDKLITEWRISPIIMANGFYDGISLIVSI